VAIEIGIAGPFVLYILGFDGLATEFTYIALILALVSQVPKRFLWRFRPYMVNRAQMIKRDTTSSFPSRAVSCATVYSFVGIWAYVYFTAPPDGPIPFKWWMPVFFMGSVLISTFARINLGVHYPSDCIAGFVQGLVVCAIGTGFWKVDVLGCTSCREKECYSNPDNQIDLRNLGRMNFMMLIAVFILCFVVPFVSVVKPIDFWAKCDRVYGILFPGVTFQLLFLCPSARAGSLAEPPSEIQWYDIVFACGVAGLTTTLCMKIKGIHTYIIYFVTYISLLAALVFWRLIRL